MRILVTGADGFVGRHLCRHLASHGHTVLAAAGPGAQTELSLDLTQPESVRACIEATRPDGLIHLAGVSSVARSHIDPVHTFAVNAQGAASLFTTLKASAPQCRVLLVGSGEMYGTLPPGEAAREDWALAPSSPYAASKVAAEVLGFQFCRSYGLPVVSARPFNHLGPGQAAQFVVPGFAAQIAAIRRGEAPAVLKTGNLDPIRDFLHVLDVVEAYRLLLEKGRAGTAYNVASGMGRSIRSLLDSMLTLSKVDARVETDPARLRPVEIPSLIGDASRLKALGWRPKRKVEEALAEVLAEQAGPLSAP